MLPWPCKHFVATTEYDTPPAALHSILTRPLTLGDVTILGVLGNVLPHYDLGSEVLGLLLLLPIRDERDDLQDEECGTPAANEYNVQDLEDAVADHLIVLQEQAGLAKKS